MHVIHAGSLDIMVFDSRGMLASRPNLETFFSHDCTELIKLDTFTCSR